MRKTIRITLLLLAFAVPAWAAGDRGRGVPEIGGTWFMNGDENLPCQIIQRRQDGQAEFVNEHGDRAWGTVRRDRVYIPEWTDGRSRGLVGRLRGNRIVWPDGNYWSR
jgi:hypothetical protein